MGSYSPLVSPQQHVDFNLLNMLKPNSSGMSTPTEMNNELFVSSAHQMLNDLFLNRVSQPANNSFTAGLTSPTSMLAPDLTSIYKQTHSSLDHPGEPQGNAIPASYDHFINSTINELEENLINNYFKHSSFSSSSSSSLSNDNHHEHKAGLLTDRKINHNVSQNTNDENLLIISQIEKLNNLTL